ncbi:MAG TPA: RNA 2',3'-cyclic phosphodiesterase [Candidatus Dormibacteraeota bacterium]|nr:RNA 2',3'-cyclic phosphodiesterase [Candidatus Dormibacteraeota bacterium]
MDARLRVFVALPIPERQRQALAGHLAASAEAAPGYRWVEPEALHLTLRFLGWLETARLDRVRAELGRVRLGPFRLRLGGLGTFPGRGLPRVIWLGLVEGTEPCASLAAQVESACHAAGVPPETRPFRPHVTLARARDRCPRPPRLGDPPPLDPWTADEFILFESRLRPGVGPRYVPLERYPLCNPP